MASLLDTLIGEAESAAKQFAGNSAQELDALNQPLDMQLQQQPQGNDYGNIFDWITQGDSNNAAQFLANAMDGIAGIGAPQGPSQSDIVRQLAQRAKTLGSNTGDVAGAVVTGGNVPAGGKMSVQSVLKAAYAAGFRGDALITAASIAMPESGYDPGSHYQPGTGEDSYGLMQINLDPSYRASRMKQLGISDPSQLFDPNTNMRAAFQISGGGKSFTPWTTYTSGKYSQYLNSVRQAAQAMGLI